MGMITYDLTYLTDSWFGIVPPTHHRSPILYLTRHKPCDEFTREHGTLTADIDPP